MVLPFSVQRYNFYPKVKAKHRHMRKILFHTVSSTLKFYGILYWSLDNDSKFHLPKAR